MCTDVPCSVLCRYQANHVVYEEEVGDIGADVIDAIEFLRWLGDSNNVGLADGLMRALAEFGQRSPYPHCRMDWCTAPGMEHLMLSSTT